MTTYESLVNLRDVASASALLAPGVLWRSDAPRDGDTLGGFPDERPPATVIDLRSAQEKRAEHPFGAMSIIIELPLLDGAITAEGMSVGTLASTYESMLEPPSAERLVSAIHAVAHAQGSVLVHCTAGKDRTGVLIALVLTLLGVDRNHIVADYARTAAAMPQVVARMALSFAEQTVPFRTEQIPAELFDAPAAVMSELLGALDSRKGGAITWFVNNGGSLASLQALRARLVRE